MPEQVEAVVIGGGQAGLAIEELQESGRHVYLCVGRAGRRPRRYRGKDFMFWVVTLGRVEQTADQLPSPSARFAANA
jgi:putative flavoprotein involved in K+ transport